MIKRETHTLKNMSVDAFVICRFSDLSFRHACVHAKSLQWYLTLCDAVDHSPPGYVGVGCQALLKGNLSDPGIEPMSLMSSNWQADSLPLMPPGKPKKMVTPSWVLRVQFYFCMCAQLHSTL